VAANAKKKKSGGQAKGTSRRTPVQSSASEYAREAASEWAKAARFGAAALLAGSTGGKDKSDDKPPLKERLNPASTEKGGRVGDAADNLLSKLGFLGKAASKFSLGSRAVDKVVPDAVSKVQPKGGGGDGGGDGEQGHPPVPIQESIDVAVPIHAAYALATRFEDYPQFSERIESAEELDDTHVAFKVKVLGLPREGEIEITEEQPEWRLEWEANEGIEHGGMLTFHELAPSLTRVELSIDLEPQGFVERLGRSINLPERAIRSELHLFKAWAELWQEIEDIEPPEEPEPEPEEEEPEEEPDEQGEDEPQGEGEDGPEDDVDEEPEDEYEDEPEDEYEDEPEDEFEDEDEQPEDEYEDDEDFEDDEEFDEPEDEYEDDEDFEDEEYEDEDELEEGEPAEAR
jgi:polyketide cyclase/dehydrase/lipid transport protein